jgi:hypothetical protein
MQIDATPRAPPELPQAHTVGPELIGQLGAVELDIVPLSPRPYELPHARHI